MTDSFFFPEWYLHVSTIFRQTMTTCEPSHLLLIERLRIFAFLFPLPTSYNPIN